MKEGDAKSDSIELFEINRTDNATDDSDPFSVSRQETNRCEDMFPTLKERREYLEEQAGNACIDPQKILFDP